MVDWISSLTTAGERRSQNCNQSRTKKVRGGTQGITKLMASITKKKTIKKKVPKGKDKQVPIKEIEFAQR